MEGPSDVIHKPQSKPRESFEAFRNLLDFIMVSWRPTDARDPLE